MTLEDLERLARGDPSELDVHLTLVQRDLAVEGTRTVIHCHHLAVDANGRLGLHHLVRFMRDCAVDYAIPRRRAIEAKERLDRTGSTSALMALQEEASALFTHLANTGEGGELLLFLFAERFLRLPQVLCKMSLKTSTSMHYHGADGVYASLDSDGVLRLHWGESKVYADPAAGTKACLESLAPFLTEPEMPNTKRAQDMFLLSEVADLGDPALVDGLRHYFDRSSPMSKRVRYCGVALVAFDAAAYPRDDIEAVAEEIASGVREALSGWTTSVGSAIASCRLERFDIHFFLLPLPSAGAFRSAFLSGMGLANAG